jgi:hypothetical protein
MKSSRYYKVVSCSGITDPDLSSQGKCPFYSEHNYDCALSGDGIEDDCVVPDDCLLRQFNIEVETDVLNQAELELKNE